MRRIAIAMFAGLLLLAVKPALAQEVPHPPGMHNTILKRVDLPGIRRAKAGHVQPVTIFDQPAVADLGRSWTRFSGASHSSKWRM
jgi:hypothetical protein